MPELAVDDTVRVERREGRSRRFAGTFASTHRTNPGEGIQAPITGIVHAINGDVVTIREAHTWQFRSAHIDDCKRRSRFYSAGVCEMRTLMERRRKNFAAAEEAEAQLQKKIAAGKRRKV